MKGARPPKRLIASDGSEGWWAHQDSNLEQAGYEPAALTVELWALLALHVKFNCQLPTANSQLPNPNVKYRPPMLRGKLGFD